MVRDLESDSIERRRQALAEFHYGGYGRIAGSQLLLPPLAKMLEDEDPFLAAAAPAALLRVSYGLLLARKEKLVEFLAEKGLQRHAGASLLWLEEDAAEALPLLSEIFPTTGPSKDNYTNHFNYYMAQLPERLLIQHAASENQRLRERAMECLRNLYRQRKSDSLAEAYLDFTNSDLPQHRKLGIEFYSIQNPTWAGHKAQLKRLLDDVDAGVRAAAATVEVDVPECKSLAVLRMLDSPLPHVRTQAVNLVTAEILADIGNDRPFIEGITSEDADFAQACLRALARAKYSPAGRALAVSLLNPDYPHRDLAIETAGYLEYPGAAMPALLQVFEQDYASRSAVVAAWTRMGPQAKSALPLLYARFDVDNVDASADALDAILAIDASDVAARRVMERYSELLASSKTKEGGTKYDHQGYRICIRLQKHGRRSQWAIPAVQEFLRHAEKSWEYHHAFKAIEAVGPDAAFAVPALEEMLDDPTHMERCDRIRATIESISEGLEFTFAGHVAPSEE
jgi:hypothetical protein